MPTQIGSTSTSLKTPRAAAVAGIAFSVLSIAIFSLLRITLPSQPLQAFVHLGERASVVILATNLVPFAGIAFLWFIAVLRDRLGEREDRFFATVFFGSGIVFLAMFFCAAAIIGSVASASGANQSPPIDPRTFIFARNLAFDLMNVYAIKLAGVFMLSASTVFARTGTMPRHLVYLGWAAGVFVLGGSQFLDWSFVVFPVWVLLISTQILIDRFRRPAPQARF